MMKRIAFVCLFSLAISSPALAQTTATFGEKQIGKGCGGLVHDTDFDTVAQCNTSAASGGLYQKAPLFVGAVTSPPYAATTCDANKAGMIQYAASTMQYCNGTSWTTIGGGGYLGTAANATSPSRSGDVTTGLFSATASTVSIATAGTERLTVTATGSVGIGTTAPGSTAVLHVVTGPDKYLVLTSTPYGMYLAADKGTSHDALIGGFGNQAFSLHTNGVERLHITATGNVGIGTASPTHTLSVVSSQLNDGIHVSSIGNGGEISAHDNAHFNVANGRTTNSPISMPYYGMAFPLVTGSAETWLAGNAGISLFTGGAERVRIDAAGNVGIGTTTPDLAKLQIETVTFVTSSPVIAISTRDGTNNPRAVINYTSSATMQRVDLDSAYNTGSGYANWTFPHGKVGVGTAAPSYLLHVNGTAYATAAAGALSDIRHKDNVKTLSSGLESVSKLRPVSFTWKKPTDNGMQGEQLGFIAQEVEKVLPQVVLTQDDKDKTKGLKYTEIIPILTKAIQELKAENDNLKTENGTLRSQLETMDARLKKLEGSGK